MELPKKDNAESRFGKELALDIFLAAIAVLITLVFFYSPGTYDVYLFQGWLKNAEEYGIRHGFAANVDMYPPLADIFQILLQRLGMSAFVALRFVNSFSLLLSALLVRVLYKSRKSAVLVFFSLFFCQTCGYLDGNMLPFMLTAFYFLKNKKYQLAGLFMSLLCLTKFQPLVFMPFLLVYFFEVSKKGLSVRWQELLHFGWPVCIMVAGTLLIFGRPAWDALDRSLHGWSETLSANALNLGWILQYVLQRFFPEICGGLVDGCIWMTYENVPESLLMIRYIFWSIFALLLLFMLPCKKSYRLFLQLSLIEYGAHFMFNIGIHENHLFIAVMLAIALYLEDPSDSNWMRAVIYALIANTNIVIFYGVIGARLELNRLILGLDITLPLSVFNVVFWIYSSAQILREIWQENPQIARTLRSAFSTRRKAGAE